MSRTTFALQSIRKIIAGQDTNCPFCGSAQTRLLQRKNVIWQLRRCQACALMFRWPKDNITDSLVFYQSAARESVVYELPSDAELSALKAGGFRDLGLDYSLHIAIVRSLRADGRLLDYGASWGYGVAQFRAAGYDAAGFEVSAPRAEFGRAKLGVAIETKAAAFADRSFDVIHTSHVLEHVPDLHIPFADFKRLLKPGGTLVIFVPNGDGKEARRLGVKYGALINEKHILALSGEFFARNLPAFGFSLRFASSTEYRPLRAFADGPDLEGEELLVVGTRN